MHLFKSFGVIRGLPVEQVIGLMNETGINKAVAMTIQGLVVDLGERTNDEIAEAVAKFPNRLIGFATVNPWTGEEAVEEVKRAVTRLGLKGLKFHSWLQGFPAHSEILYPIFDLAAKLKIPATFHSGTPPYAQPLQIADLAEHYPDVPIILAHFGMADLWVTAIKAAKRLDNLYLETSGNVIAPALEAAVREVGADRMIFGTDGPWGDISLEILKVRTLRTSDEDKELIFWKNIAGILNLKNDKNDLGGSFEAFDQWSFRQA